MPVRSAVVSSNFVTDGASGPARLTIEHYNPVGGWQYAATVSTIGLAGVLFLAGDTKAAAD